jgi:hypothetical protein
VVRVRQASRIMVRDFSLQKFMRDLLKNKIPISDELSNTQGKVRPRLFPCSRCGGKGENREPGIVR